MPKTFAQYCRQKKSCQSIPFSNIYDRFGILNPGEHTISSFILGILINKYTKISRIHYNIQYRVYQKRYNRTSTCFLQSERPRF